MSKYIQKYNSDKTVVAAAKERMGYIFDSFREINVSISGGKDSTVVAWLAINEAKRRGRKIGIVFIDEEVVYQSTVDQVEYIMDLGAGCVDRWWLQFPFLLTNAVSLEEGQLICWEQGKHKEWVHPRNVKNVLGKPWASEKEHVGCKRKGSMIGFYDVIYNFQNQYAGAVFLVGLRAAGESLHRWRAMVKNPVEINGDNVFWGTAKGENYNLYPIYDWLASDVWRFIYENGIRYSKVYDWQFRKGQNPASMRVSSLIHEKSFKSICDLPEFEPKTYDRLLNRIKGMSFAQETGKNAKMFRVSKLPKNYKTWSEYRDFLLKTYPDQERGEIFRRRFSKHLDNQYVARQQCRQLILNDYENNLPVENKPDPRDELIAYYKEVL